MKSFYTILFLFIKLISIAQDNDDLPYSTIILVRTQNRDGSLCNSDIIFPNQKNFNLGLNSEVKFKIYSVGKITANIEIVCPGTKIGSDVYPLRILKRQVDMNIKNNEVYYYLFDFEERDEVDGGLSFETVLKEVSKNIIQPYLDKARYSLKYEENLDSPINGSLSNKREKKQGTCFLLNSQGYLITNYHCIENSKEIIIRGINGDFTTRYTASIVASDPTNDLVLIKLNNKSIKFKNPPYSIRSNGVFQAEKVYALGYPMTFAMGEEMKITEGIISSKSGVQGDLSKFQISAIVNPGNSGGPLIDFQGNLIGVINAKSSIAEGAGYAIKASYLESFLKNVDGFIFPTLVNSIKDKPIIQKIAILKSFIYIIESN
ncbi:MAG: trypsin-like peptidase domain-containing protein [Opitutaceae bacterium]|nr:trypsin-like peptidase domain-containing protein [Cytophagales bacterium]